MTHDYEKALNAINGEYGLLVNDDIPVTKAAIIHALKTAAGCSSVPEWMPIETAPKDGTAFYVRFQSPMRWLPYKKDARRQGYPAGRWQEMTEYGGWENSDVEPLEWKPHAKDIDPAGEEV